MSSADKTVAKIRGTLSKGVQDFISGNDVKEISRLVSEACDEAVAMTLRALHHENVQRRDQVLAQAKDGRSEELTREISTLVSAQAERDKKAQEAKRKRDAEINAAQQGNRSRQR